MSAYNVAAHAGLALALLSPLWLARHDRDQARRLAVTLGLTALTVVALQAIVARPRPGGGALVTLGLSFYSFPSGHAAAAFAAATFVGLGRGARWRALTLIAAVGVAVSRVGAGVHFPSDVVVAAILGAGFGAAGYGWGEREAGGIARPHWAWLLFPWLAIAATMAVAATYGLVSVHNILFAGGDKALHFVIFGGVAFFCVAWFADRPPGRIIFYVCAAALFDENLQRVWPGRTVDAWDGLLSVAGAVVFGAVAAVVVSPFLIRHHIDSARFRARDADTSPSR